MDDLLDLFGDRKRATETKCDQVAPVELMSQFLILISERKMEEALALTNEILFYEPNNQMILEYKRSLAVYIQQAEGEVDVELSSDSESQSVQASESDDSDDDSDASSASETQEDKSNRK